MSASPTNSTIVRAFARGERWAPSLAVRLATRVWFTIPPAIPRERLPALPPGPRPGRSCTGAPCTP